MVVYIDVVGFSQVLLWCNMILGLHLLVSFTFPNIHPCNSPWALDIDQQISDSNKRGTADVAGQSNFFASFAWSQLGQPCGISIMVD